MLLKTPNGWPVESPTLFALSVGEHVGPELGLTRLRLPTHRWVRPLDDAPRSQVLDPLVVVAHLPKQGLGVLADLV